MPNDEDLTPPRGGAKRNTQYAKINDRDLLERMADHAQHARAEAKAARAEVSSLRDEVRLALRPTHRAWHEKLAPAAIAAVLFLWLIVWTTRTSSATVPEPQSQARR